nr:MAG TPA: Nuclease [Caudoviricetes sp.]
MREKQIEQKLGQAVKKKGGLCLKFVSPNFDGMPDRLILLPHGKIAFAELKAPSKKPRPLQIARHNALMKLGFRVFVIDSAEQIGEILDEIQST